jgi:hypothetical protein
VRTTTEKNLFWISLVLLLISYLLWGWIVSEANVSSVIWLSERFKFLGLYSSEINIAWTLRIIAIAFILLVALALVVPSRFMKFCFGNLLDLNQNRWLSVIVWSLAFVCFIYWLEHFVRISVLICAGMLARMELQIAGYNQWQSFLVLAITSLSGFVAGLFLFNFLNPKMPTFF